jgi:hypothetical protein
MGMQSLLAPKKSSHASNNSPLESSSSNAKSWELAWNILFCSGHIDPHGKDEGGVEVLASLLQESTAVGRDTNHGQSQKLQGDKTRCLAS